MGLGTARALQRTLGATVSVCEKEDRPGAHQSTHNSGVLHAGLYYAPGSFKARLAVRGIRLMTAFAREHAVPHEICGKVVVATDEAEAALLRGLLDRGTSNGLRGLTWLNGEEVREREPHVRAVAGLVVPEEGIIDYARVVAALRDEIQLTGGAVHVKAPVTRAIRQGSGWTVIAGNSEHAADFVVNCAGLHSDRVARLFGERPTTRIIPFRGDYFELQRTELVRHLIYPVPDPAFPFLGVHFTRGISGSVECGPTAVLSLDREGYGRTAFNWRDATDALRFSGLWRFLAAHPRATMHEVVRAHAPRQFLAALQRLIPDVRMDDLHRGPSGIRAQAVRPNGTLVQDFDFMEGPGSLHVLNAPSPGATASLAIGEHIASRVAAAAGLQMRQDALH